MFRISNKTVMTNQLKHLETALGGKLEQNNARIIPGVFKKDGAEVIYFSAPPKGNHRKQFRSITNYTNPPFAKFGGVNESGCCIVLPDGTSFHSLTYHGDLVGWKKDIEEGAKSQGSLLAQIDGRYLHLFDGRTIELNTCTINFD